MNQYEWNDICTKRQLWLIASYVPLIMILRAYFDYTTGKMLFAWYSIIAWSLMYAWNRTTKLEVKD